MMYCDYANQFWKENCRKRFQTREVALYFFLLQECNKNYWVMPVICTTEYVCNSLHISRQTLCAARKCLAERGLIGFSEGKWSSEAPTYSILEIPDGETDGGTGNTTGDRTRERTKERTSGSTKGNTSDVTDNRTTEHTSGGTIIKEENRPYMNRQDNVSSSSQERGAKVSIEKYRNINGQWK